MTMVTTGIPAEYMPVASPSMMVVAGPIWAWKAMPRVGLYSALV